MKKVLLMAAAILAVSLMGCKDNKEAEAVAKYKAQGELYAAQLDSLWQVQDTLAIFAMDDSIRAKEEEVKATGFDAALTAFQEALMGTRERFAADMVVMKTEKGTATKKEALEEVASDGLNGDVSISTVTRSINKAGAKTLEDAKREHNKK